MATKTSPKALQAPLDFSAVNFIGLGLAIVILTAFIYTPWLWEEIKYNGARLMSDVLTAGSLKNYSTWQIALIPVSALLAAGLAAWGLLNSSRGWIASALTSATGLLGLYYYIDLYLVREGEIPDYIRANAGLGSKIVFVGILGLIFQLILVYPDLNRAFQAVTRRLGVLKPPIPQKWIPYLFLLPPLILYVIWIIAPTFYTFYLSLTDWDSVSTPNYIGFRNYETLFSQNTFREALLNNARWLIIFITVPTTLGLGLALIFNTDMRGGRWYKVSFYSPLVLSWPVIALVWSWLYHPSKGLLNSLLTSSGITDSPPGWLADRDIAILCIIAAATWRQVGYVMVLYLAGLKNVDPTLIDAGLVDGANRWQLFRHIILPLLAPVTTIVFIISVIDSLRSFDLVQVMTRGHQGTQVLANYMYIEAFNNYRMGFGAAIAVILFSISLIFVGLYLWRTLKDELEY